MFGFTFSVRFGRHVYLSNLEEDQYPGLFFRLPFLGLVQMSDSDWWQFPRYSKWRFWIDRDNPRYIALRLGPKEVCYTPRWVLKEQWKREDEARREGREQWRKEMRMYRLKRLAAKRRAVRSVGIGLAA